MDRHAARSAVRAFIRDWLVCAPIPVSIALVLSAFLQENMVSTEISNGALLSYSLALCWAYLDDLPLGDWDNSGSKVLAGLAIVFPFSKFLITIIALLLATVASVAHQNPDLLPSVTPGKMLGFSAFLALFTFLAAVVVLRDRLHRNMIGGAK